MRRVAALALAAAPLIPPVAQAQCLPMMCGFTENGKKGPYLKAEVNEKELAKADAAIREADLSGALSGAGSINSGELHGNGLRMPQTEAALGELLGRLRAQWPYRQPERVRVRIIANSGFVPSAFSDQIIVVPLGMLMHARTDDQIAWLLGHEFSHLALGHFSREAKVRRGKGVLSGAVALVQTGLAASQVDWKFDNNGTLRSQGTMSAEGRALSERIYLRANDLKMVLALANQFFSRKQEDQADVLGLDLAIAAKFNDGGASEALNEMGRMDGRAKSLFESISSEMTRYTKLSAQQALENGQNLTDVKASASTFGTSFLDNLKTVALSKTFDFYTQTHRPTGKRREGVLKYYGNAYKKVPSNPESTAWLDKLRMTSEYQDAERLVNGVSKADDLRVQGKAIEAMAELKPLFATAFRTTPYLANAAAEVYRSAGLLAEADQQFSIAARLPGNGAGVAVAPRPARAPARGKKKGAATRAAPAAKPVDLTAGTDPYFEQTQDGFLRHVDLLIEMKNLNKAMNVIDVATGRLGDDYAFLPAKIQIYAARRRYEEMVAALMKCAQSLDEGLRRRCNGEIKGADVAKALETASPQQQAEVKRNQMKLEAVAETKGFWTRFSDSLKPPEE